MVSPFFSSLSVLCVRGIAVASVLWVAGATAQTRYQGDGEPTAYEEEVRWLLNRARFSRAKENALRGTNYTDVPASVGPLAPNAMLMQAARNHCDDLARTNRFQHATVPGSRFYNRSLYPQPWDRMEAEGYDWDLAGENIAAGYTSAVSVYVGWWKSAGHRTNMGNRDFCEIGNGYHYRAGSEYRYYQGMSLGRSWNKRFFTGTLFHDKNNNKAYGANEGVGGVRVDLAVGAALHPHYDISTGVGSFAVPMDGIAEGAVVQVRLTNTTNVAAQLSVPKSYDQYELLTLEPGASVGWGGFTRSASLRNYGFRDAVMPAASLALTPGSREHGAPGSNGASITVSSPVPVNWVARSEVPWMTIVGNGTGQQGGSLTYAVEANPLGEVRTGRIVFEVGGQIQGVFVVSQTGVPPVLGVAGGLTEMEVAGGEVNAVVSGNVSWVATTAVHWLRVVGAGQGQAQGVVRVRVANNAGSAERTGVLTVVGAGITRTVEVRQAGAGARSVAEMVEVDLAEGVGQVISVSGLPPGVRWETGSQRMTGQFSRAGSYRLRVRVRHEDGRVIQHEVVIQVNPLAEPYVGRFEARVTATPGHATADLGGIARFTIAGTGVATGTLELAMGRRVFRGRLVAQPGVAPRLQVLLPRVGEGGTELELEFGENHLVQGQLRTNGVNAAMNGWRRLWQAQSHPVAEVRIGRSHVLIDIGENWLEDEAVPQGAGYLVVNVSRAGDIRWVGRLGDGTGLTGTGFLGPASQWQGWQPRYARKGAFRWFGLWDNQMTLHCTGEWEKRGATNAADRLYPAGFGQDQRGAVQVVLSGVKWQPEQMAAVLAAAGNDQTSAPHWVLKFAEGVLNDTAVQLATRPVRVEANNRLRFLDAASPVNREKLTLRFNPRTGLVAGGFRLEDDHPLEPGRVIRRQVNFQGLWLSPDRFAAGYFVGVRLPDASGGARLRVSGLVMLQPASALD